MKKLILFLVLLSNFAFGQTLPVVVDNSKYFPPVRSQEALPNCTQFSLIYYLKSAIWNQKFNRDPKLEINQFNHNFVWDQTVHPVYEKSNAEIGFYFMKEQGCATMADFPANEQTTKIMPSVIAKTNALVFKSKKLWKTDFASCGGDYNNISKLLNSLKDSLSQGKCFTLNILIFDSFFKMTVDKNIYSCYGSVSLDSIRPSHVVTVVGYDDNIKTASGKGALKIIDSNASLVNGIFYFDYNWFFLTNSDYTCFFLEEDFYYQPKIFLNLNIGKYLTGSDIYDNNQLFVDTVQSLSGKRFDYINYYSYLYPGNQIQVVEVNGRKLKMRGKTLMKSLNNLDGNYELVSDLSDLSSVADFKSAAIVVFDPVSVNFIDFNNKSFLSYNRESKFDIEKAYLSFTGMNQKIVAKVIDLADTTIVVTDFYSIVAGLNLQPFQEQIHVKSCTSVLKRKLITFSVTDLKTNAPPIFTQVSSSANVLLGTVWTGKFIASDPEGEVVKYSISSGTGATINSVSGDFSFSATTIGSFPFSIKASDGVNDIVTSFVITVVFDNPPLILDKPANQVNVYSGEAYDFRFVASDPDGKSIKFTVNPPSSNFLTVSINETTGEYHFLCPLPNSGQFLSTVNVSDGTLITSFTFTINVVIKNANNPPVFTQVPSGDLTVTQGAMASFTFKASDPENAALTYSIKSGTGAIINSSTGVFSYPTTAIGIFAFSVNVSDGVNNVSTNFNVKVEAIVNNPPVFTQVPNGDLIVTQGANASFTFKASDPENDALIYSIKSGTGANINSSTGVFSYQTTAAGLFAFSVNVSDGVNNVSTNFNVKVDAPINNAPTFINIPGDLIVHVNIILNYQFEASDKENDPLTFSLLNPPAEAQMSSTGKLTFNSNKVGTYTLTVVASDGKLSTNLLVTVIVDLGTGIDDPVVSDFLFSIYPNPVVSNMNIEVNMKSSGLLNLTLYDLQGHQIAVIAQSEGFVGKNTFAYNTSNLKSGVYICYLTSENLKKSIKIIKH